MIYILLDNYLFVKQKNIKILKFLCCFFDYLQILKIVCKIFLIFDFSNKICDIIVLLNLVVIDVKKWKKIMKYKNILWCGIACFFMSCILSYMTCVLLSPNIEIEEKEIVLNYGEKYQEPEYRAMIKNQDVTDRVVKSGVVDENKVGVYHIQYDIKYSIFESKKVVTVKVVDREAPVISLVGGEHVSVCPDKNYVELGYSAIDNYDGDISDRVSVLEKENNIVYQVQDSSHNKASIKRVISKEDIDSPDLTLKGSDTVTIYVGELYQEPGYIATDLCDGNLTEQVKVSENVNSSIPGSYQISYQVQDSHQNKTTVTRNVIVKNRVTIRPFGGGNGKGIVYLTFDDGPNEGTTNVILDILKSEGVSATFFVTCNGPDYLIRRMYEEGHTVALHTATHNYNYVYASEINYFNDLARVSDRVERITGEKSKIIRFPGGSSNTVSKKLNIGIMTRLTQEVLARGYHYFDWNVDSEDAAGADSKSIYSNVINNLSPNRENVVLMHDVKIATRDTLRNMIQTAKQNGYTFRKITYDTVMVTHGVNN